MRYLSERTPSIVIQYFEHLAVVLVMLWADVCNRQYQQYGSYGAFTVCPELDKSYQENLLKLTLTWTVIAEWVSSLPSVGCSRKGNYLLIIIHSTGIINLTFSQLHLQYIK